MQSGITDQAPVLVQFKRFSGEESVKIYPFMQMILTDDSNFVEFGPEPVRYCL